MGWRWLTRMRTALYLLGLLALQTAFATVVPQEPNVPTTVRAWRTGEEGPGVVASNLIDAIGGYDVYGSGLFLALLLLLYLSLTACLIPRIRAWVRLVRHSKPPLVRHVGKQDETATLTTDRAPDEVHATAQQLLGRRHWRLRAHEPDPAESSGGAVPTTPTPAQLAAEKGLWSREGGSLVFHLSFYVVLVAAVLGQLLSFEGQRGVVEGEAGFHDTAISYWSYSPGRWFAETDHDGWRLDLEQFEVDWVRDPLAPGAGQPTVFRSEVTITPRDGEPFAETIDSNRPVMIDGRRVTQLDWGYAPRVVVEVDGEVVHDGFLQSRVSPGGFFTSAVKAPAAQPDVGHRVWFYPFAPDDEDGRAIPTGAPWDDAPLLVLEQFRGDLQLGATQQTINELDISGLESDGSLALRLGQSVEYEGVTITFPELRRWVGFQVASRPQLPALLAGGVLLVLGLIPALYAYRRRLWVVATPEVGTGRTLVTVAGRAFQRPEAFTEEHREIVRELAAAIDADRDDAVGHDGPGRGTPPSSGHPDAADHDPDDRRADGLPERSTISDRRSDVLPQPVTTGTANEVRTR